MSAIWVTESAGSAEVEGVIGFIAQDDLLLEDLTVYQNLYYNAKLCFRDINEEDLKDPHLNLHVGAYILKNQLTGKLISGAKDKIFTVYYWEVLHAKYQQRVISSFLKFKSEVPFCE